ncbi:glycosyltransferase family 2 protein [Candidatus Synechococcus calcipolaris G9]|uniref:Glycosyltransferase family 2 protein n=1 Tax=Candidatus Synechococcus calcipolaris G9 TaxID=1497997 RepID=A0ABT6F2J4_9SYNE|nr:glycosyltransferase family 2 protein [Candidatus Synechococcus calcipolaris]MDG2992076.1 glycosyltransferase family 2 protein [Candidatus Synechococcus calcipolaris G9]
MVSPVPLLSIIIPCYNEATNLENLFERLFQSLETLSLSYEVICVNDGSRDDTLARLLTYHHRHPPLKVISLSRNFGKDIALTAGIDHSCGQAVVPLDADLQDPPEVLGEMVELWRQGFDVVYGTRLRRQENWLKRLTAHGFYQVLGWISAVPIPANTGDFRLMDRRVVDALRQMPERNRFMKGLFTWVGFRQTAVYFDRPRRHRGQTKWSYWQLWNFALNAIFSFSVKPLQVWIYIGLCISTIALLYAFWLVLRTLIYGVDLPGYPSLMVAVLFMGGVQLLTLGIMGEYLGRIYEEVKGRPLYLVRDRYGFSDPSPDNASRE